MGSAEQNIKLSKRALSRGMKLTHKGLTKNGKLIASKTDFLSLVEWIKETMKDLKI